MAKLAPVPDVNRTKPPKGRCVMHVRRLAGIVLAATLTLGAACDDEDKFEPTVTPDGGQITVTPVQPVGQVPAQPNQRVREVFIYADRLDPPSVELTANTPTQLQVANRSGKDCAFFLGEFVQPSTITAGETRGLSFTTPATETQAGTMGCKDDPGRQGGFTVERRGVPVAP